MPNDFQKSGERNMLKENGRIWQLSDDEMKFGDGSPPLAAMNPAAIFRVCTFC